MTHTITRLSAGDFRDNVKELAELLADAVDGGASLGFLASLDRSSAADWWHTRAPAVADGSLVVWVSRGPEGVNGTVSLAFEGKANGRHRAEVVKLMVHRHARGRGVGRDLLTAAERAAVQAGVSLLLLDTETGSHAESLYGSAGWTRYGVVPDYAADPAGRLRDCSFFYKRLG
ncbi:GNAT family N-acetyltransferase [Planomonospora sp. ID67723]|uniref:GNAT family N-acetyltransferase n=1 Tax=Planomonospora sp. ID67723 TaxID=2738134 RepID=UPI0018C4038B|nr:GNAT family N-acetyltransferase [Planomonospora sp. ID67723]MBG0833141.1 GNAT family N-acetyltransferase [Planomonospora sp. ID67723]